MSAGNERSAREWTPSSSAALAFLALVVVQGFHELEHIVQVLQRFVLHNPKGAGILGSWLDIEPVHLGYNLGFLLLVGSTYYLGRFHRRETRPQPTVFWLMTFVLAFQTYHVTEHLFKIAQFIQTGMNGTPGILGNVFNLVWLHFTYNTIEYVPVLAAYFVGGFHGVAMAALRRRSWLAAS
jgi:hypothetical protein